MTKQEFPDLTNLGPPPSEEDVNAANKKESNKNILKLGSAAVGLLCFASFAWWVSENASEVELELLKAAGIALVVGLTTTFMYHGLRRFRRDVAHTEPGQRHSTRFRSLKE